MKEMRKHWKSAPLPFQGQKRVFVKKFKAALAGYSDQATFVDLFGGSGLLSHTVKNIYPEANVIYNDFDGFSERLKHIPETNKIIEELRAILEEHPRGKSIKEYHRDEVLKVLRAANKKNYVDWLSLSGSLMFSMKYGKSYEDFEKATLYNTVRKSDFAQADEYLNGIEVVQEDYRDLWSEFKDQSNVVFLVDPPYLSTDVKSYKGYWELKDYLKVLDVLDGSYFYFTSNKSQIVELCEWIETRTPMSNPFSEATRTVVRNNVNYQSSYDDIMYHIKK